MDAVANPLRYGKALRDVVTTPFSFGDLSLQVVEMERCMRSSRFVICHFCGTIFEADLLSE